jgi:hypothetical protein
LHSPPSSLARKKKTSQDQRKRPRLRTRRKVRNMQPPQRAIQRAVQRVIERNMRLPRRVILRNMRLLATNQPLAAPPRARAGAIERITPAGNARLQTQRNVSTAPFRGAPRGQANAQRFQARQFNLANKPNPAIASAKFRANNQIQGSQNWQGQNYQAFRTYRSQWHDSGWWGQHYSRVGLFGGGWYYWNSGFWYPAWGYDPGYSYYPYDGPIYGYNNLPPDQVVANVQTALQEQGYYHGEVDGLLGPLTRAAIADYQRDQGLYITSAIDEPTLSALGMT